MTGRPTVVLVHLGSAGSMGGRRRVASLRAIFTAAGAEVVDVTLLADHRVGPAHAGRLLGQLGAVASGRVVPEALAWDHRAVLARLRAIGADAVVCISARAYHPALLDGPWRLVLDYVDRLSDSYVDRAGILGPTPRALLFRSLAITARRFERRALPPGATGVAAGWDDARVLGLGWLPITIETVPPEPEVVPEPRHDLLFLGKLSYPPNIEAIERLGAIWPAVQAARPGTTLLLAGAAPGAAVVALAHRLGWTVEADFDDLATVLASARLATAPLRHASGIQIKVLDAATHRLAQVISPAVAKGFGPGMPIAVADDDEELVATLVRLLDDPAARTAQAHDALGHVEAEYSVARWVPWASGVLGDPST